ncbi:hypothetical protein N9H18_02140 [Candidatus Thioglobus sp.]|nr:hypothetical protein [Candidatus Thioglobus sp.]MDA8981400.1 hypothetical protein [Candidatus Thioglobus sp.]
MNILTTVLSILIFLGFVVGGYLLGKHTSSILDFGEGLFVWLTILCASIWFGRGNKDGIYRLLKDTHQSNLDDIEQQQLEEQIDQAIVKEQILNSVAVVWFFLFLVICCVSFLISQESIGVIDWLIALSIIAAPLILAYFVGEWFVDTDDTEENEAGVIQ